MGIETFLQGNQVIGILDLPTDTELNGLVDQTVLMSESTSMENSIAGIYGLLSEFGEKYVSEFRAHVIEPLYQKRDALSKSEKNHEQFMASAIDSVLRTIDQTNYRSMVSESPDYSHIPSELRHWFENGTPVFTHLTSEEGLKGIVNEGLKGFQSNPEPCAFVFPNMDVLNKQMDKTYQSRSGARDATQMVAFETDEVPKTVQRCGGGIPYVRWGRNLPIDRMDILYKGPAP